MQSGCRSQNGPWRSFFGDYLVASAKLRDPQKERGGGPRRVDMFRKVGEKATSQATKEATWRQPA